MFLAKTLKIELSLESGAHFQEIEDQKKTKNQAKIDEKSHVFWGVDFGCILDRFWEGFGKPKSPIFVIVFDVFPKSILKHDREEQKSTQKTEKTQKAQI